MQNILGFCGRTIARRRFLERRFVFTKKLCRRTFKTISCRAFHKVFLSFPIHPTLNIFFWLFGWFFSQSISTGPEFLSPSCSLWTVFRVTQPSYVPAFRAFSSPGGLLFRSASRMVLSGGISETDTFGAYHLASTRPKNLPPGSWASWLVFPELPPSDPLWYQSGRPFLICPMACHHLCFLGTISARPFLTHTIFGENLSLQETF